MKKTYRNIIFVTSIFLMLITSIFALNVFATSESEYESCSDYYFSNLNGKNVPYNVTGSCGYVATSMLLAYYDAYWNDNFVANEYSNDSYLEDGVFISSTIKSEAQSLIDNHDEYVENGGNMEELEYLSSIYSDFFANNQNKGYLHLDLIRRGIDAGYYSGSDPNEEYSIGLNQIAKILDDYFDNIFGTYRYYDPYGLNVILGQNPPIKIKILDSESRGNSHDEVVAKMYELLDMNIPVMYEGYRNNTRDGDKSGKDDKEGHVLIAYDLEKDSNNNIVDCKFHTGWSSPSTYLWEENKFNLNTSILWLEIDESRIPHVCSDNYVIGNEKYCSCQVYGDLHPQHTHLYDGLIPYDNDQHTYKCKWGCRIKEDHELIHKVNGDRHSWACECGYSYEEPYITVCQSINCHVKTYECGIDYEMSHNPIYSSISDTHHNGTCECGYTFDEEHSFEYETILVLGKHKKTCSCGYSIQESHSYEYQQVSDEQHSLICGCGDSRELNHSVAYWERTNIGHTWVCVCGYREQSEHNMVAVDYHTSSCTDCGYTRVTPHEPPYQQLSDTQHLVSCGCGYEGAENHIFTYTNISASLHRMTCECGYTALEVHTFKPTTNPRYQSCTKCGCVRDNFGPGGNVQMGKKEDEETE